VKLRFIVMFMTIGVLASCGYESPQSPQPAPIDVGGDDDPGPGDPPPPPPPPVTGDALVKKECGRCHQPGGVKPNPKITTVAELRRAGGAGDIRDGSMPPDRRLDDATKRALLAL
jgi:mono/diheme cytochrome c family protein